jgi:hypothetical protein
MKMKIQGTNSSINFQSLKEVSTQIKTLDSFVQVKPLIDGFAKYNNLSYRLTELNPDKTPKTAWVFASDLLENFRESLCITDFSVNGLKEATIGIIKKLEDKRLEAHARMGDWAYKPKKD